MIDLSPALLSALPAIVTPVAVVDGGIGAPSGSFGQTLGAFLDAHDAAVEEPTALPLATGRQALAADGKDLPEASPSDEDRPEITAVPAWFAALPLPVTPAVAGSGVAATASVTATIAMASAPASTAQIETTPDAAVRSRPVESAAPAIPPPPASVPPATDPHAEAAIAAFVATDATATRTTSPTIARPVADGTVVAAPKASTDPSIATPLSPPVGIPPAARAIAVSTVPQPAGQVFAAALAFAGSWHDRDTRGGRADQTDATALFASQAPLDLRERAVVNASAQTGHGALDLTRDSGLQGMIDRIETLRDAAGEDADARDTRVRLVPDALGSIDVSVQQQGDRVHVRFTAEHEATRVLIAEAQPRLTELAAARGLRIGETSVSTGGGDGNPAQPQLRPTPPRAPAAPASAHETDLSTDHRLA